MANLSCTSKAAPFLFSWSLALFGIPYFPGSPGTARILRGCSLNQVSHVFQALLFRLDRLPAGLKVVCSVQNIDGRALERELISSVRLHVLHSLKGTSCNEGIKA